MDVYTKDDKIKTWLNSVMLALAIYYTFAMVTMIVHIYHRRGNTVNKLTLWPYILIATNGAVQIVNYAASLTFPKAQENLTFVIVFCSFQRMFWLWLALIQFFVWDLVSAIVRFQAKYRLEDIDVKKEEHSREEKMLLNIYKKLWSANIIYHIVRLVLPPIVANLSRDFANKVIWMIFIFIDILIYVLVIVASIVSVSRVLATTKKNYFYMYEKIKVSYTWIGVCLVASFAVLLPTSLVYFVTLDRVKCYSDGTCESLIEAQVNRSMFIIFLEFIANNVPMLTFVFFNSPCDFMVYFNRYPEHFPTVSIIQYKYFHRVYDNREIVQYIGSRQGTGIFGVSLTSPLVSPPESRSASLVQADRLFKDTEIMQRVAGTIIDTEEDMSPATGKSKQPVPSWFSPVRRSKKTGSVLSKSGVGNNSSNVSTIKSTESINNFKK